MLVNGAFCTLRQWDHVVADLATGHQVIRHDVRGTGQSKPGPPADNRFERYADDIADLCAERGLATVDLWGMAWGARVALVTAARHPDLVDRLVLSDLAIDPADPAAQKAGAAEAKAKRAAAGIAEVAPPVGAYDHRDREAAASTLSATHQHPDLMPFVERVAATTLIATGRFDPNLASSRRALTGLSDGRLQVLELTGHGSVLQRPDHVLSVVKPFLAPRRKQP